MNVPAEVYGLIAQHLCGSIRAQVRLARVCRAAFIAVSSLVLEPISVRAHIVFYERNLEGYIPIRVCTDDANRLLDHIGERHCDITIEDLCIRVRRYKHYCLVGMIESGNLFHEYLVNRNSCANAATTGLIIWAAPGVIHESLQTPANTRPFYRELIMGPRDVGA